MELDISDCSLLNQAAIALIVDNLSDTLVSLSISRCTKIHPAELLDLVEMPHLTHLNVYGMLVENNLKILRRNLPHISINENPLSTTGRASAAQASSAGKRSSDRDGNILWDVKLWQWT